MGSVNSYFIVGIGNLYIYNWRMTNSMIYAKQVSIITSMNNLYMDGLYFVNNTSKISSFNIIVDPNAFSNTLLKIATMP